MNAPTLNPDWARLPVFDRSKWQRLRFGEFAQSINERVDPGEAAEDIYVGLEHLDPESLHIRRWGKGSDVIGTKLRFQKGDIIFGRRRAYQRKLAVAEFDGICSAHSMVVRAKPEIVMPEFLPFLMMSDRFMNRAVEISVGSLSPTINWTTLKLEEFNLPPLDQQRRIAEILWAADAALVANESLVQELGLAKRALQNERLTEGNGKKHWQRTTLSHVTKRISVGLAISVTGYYRSCGIPLIRNQNIRPLFLDDTEVLFLDPDFANRFENKKLRTRDVITTRTGANIGQTCLVPEKYAGAHSFTTVIITCDEDRVVPEYLVQHMNASVGVREIERLGTTGGKGNLNVTDLASYRIELPPVAEQHESARKLGAMDAAKTELVDNVHSLHAILHELLSAFMN